MFRGGKNKTPQSFYHLYLQPGQINLMQKGQPILRSGVPGDPMRPQLIGQNIRPMLAQAAPPKGKQRLDLK